jgi:AcrR family transcriptional regulator
MKKKAPAPTDTKQSILDASEILFARDGYRGTSIRAITEEAGVNVAAVNYHFGSKKRLLEEVIKRRILPLNQIRRKRIEEVRDRARSRGRHPDIKDILVAFIEPTISFKEKHPDARNFITFISRSFSDPDDTVRKTFHRFINPMFQLLSEAVHEALPKLSQDDISWRLHFTIGALIQSMQMMADADAKALLDHIIPYVTAGMKAK